MKEEITELLPRLRRFAYSLTGSLSDADDLLQNTVERLLTRDMPDDADLTKWAFRVCRNVWIDECRARKVRRDAAEHPELTDGQVINGEHQTTKEIEWHRVDAAMACPARARDAGLRSGGPLDGDGRMCGLGPLVGCPL